jgi:hypothetical protein
MARVQHIQDDMLIWRWNDLERGAKGALVDLAGRLIGLAEHYHMVSYSHNTTLPA